MLLLSPPAFSCPPLSPGLLKPRHCWPGVCSQECAEGGLPLRASAGSHLAGPQTGRFGSPKSSEQAGIPPSTPATFLRQHLLLRGESRGPRAAASRRGSPPPVRAGVARPPRPGSGEDGDAGGSGRRCLLLAACPQLRAPLPFFLSRGGCSRAPLGSVVLLCL